MRKAVALVVLLGAILVAIPIAIILVVVGAHHVFSTNGGLVYYGITIALGVGSAFAIPISWGILADD